MVRCWIIAIVAVYERSRYRIRGGATSWCLENGESVRDRGGEGPWCGGSSGRHHLRRPKWPPPVAPPGEWGGHGERTPPRGGTPHRCRPALPPPSLCVPRASRRRHLAHGGREPRSTVPIITARRGHREYGECRSERDACKMKHPPWEHVVSSAFFCIVLPCVSSDVSPSAKLRACDCGKLSGRSGLCHRVCQFYGSWRSELPGSPRSPRSHGTQPFITTPYKAGICKNLHRTIDQRTLFVRSNLRRR